MLIEVTVGYGRVDSYLVYRICQYAFIKGRLFCQKKMKVIFRNVQLLKLEFNNKGLLYVPLIRKLGQDEYITDGYVLV
jgi:hypothetical protein